MATSTTSDLQKNWFILSSLVSKDFKLKYRRSVLGILWSVLNPLLMMVVLSIVFSHFFRFQIESYPVYLILGQILFTFMSDATSSAMGSIIDSAPLIKKIRINTAVFPLEKATFSLVNFGFSLIAAIAVMIFFQVSPSANVLLLPVLVLFVFLFSLGLGFLLSALTVFFRDVMHLWSVLTTAWMYLTPIFYPIDILPESLMPVIQFNPMYHYVGFFREIMLYGTTPSLESFIICTAMALITLIIGYLVFVKLKKKFILYV